MRGGSEFHCPFDYADVGANVDGCREAQPKSCRTSLAGGVSAGCLGSMSRLQITMSVIPYGVTNIVARSPPPVEILKISLFL